MADGERIEVTSLTMTCSACPSQWEGLLDDGRVLYCRYRWGTLEIGVGETLTEAVRNRNWCRTLGDAYHGVMSEDELLPHLGEFLAALEATP